MSTSSLQEIYQQPPSTATRLGIPLMVLFLLLCAVGATFVSFEDTVEGPVVLTTRVQPIRLLPIRDGVLREVRVREGDVVREGDLVAIYENDASYAEVLDLLRQTEELLAYDRSDFLKLTTPERRTQLGDLSTVHENFLAQHERFLRSTVTAGAIVQADDRVVDDLAQTTRRNVNSLRAERNEILRQITQSRKILAATKANYLDGDIPQQKYNEAVTAHNRLEEKVKLIEARITQAQREFNVRRSNQTSTSGKLRARQDDSYNDLRTTLLNLHDALLGWQQRNLLRATATGTVAFADGLNPAGTPVNPAQPILSILPAELDTNRGVVAHLRLDASERVRLHSGQTVRIRLEGFDSFTDGYLIGVVGEIPQVLAEEQKFIIPIDLPDGMQTHRGVMVPYSEGMSGAAEVICGEQNLLGVVF